jgi:ubiquinone/menaquinone biosynthesis C-methylase UbiE
MLEINNWDNKTWLSSHKYIKSFNFFLLKQKKLNKSSKILDIGCGRGKILGTLSSKLGLKNKPLGIDITNHKDKDKRIRFRKIDASSFFLKNKSKFDLILIKQTIHLLDLKEIKKLLILSKKNLSQNGRIFIFTLDPDKNELPTFKLMKKKLIKSLNRDKEILKIITKLYPCRIKKKFIYKVEIFKKKYLKMIQNRYISTLLSLSKKKLLKGVEEINLKYKNNIIRFNDKLICIIIKNAS